MHFFFLLLLFSFCERFLCKKNFFSITDERGENTKAKPFTLKLCQRLIEYVLCLLAAAQEEKIERTRKCGERTERVYQVSEVSYDIHNRLQQKAKLPLVYISQPRIQNCSREE
jgi:hypothetical protein